MEGVGSERSFLEDDFIYSKPATEQNWTDPSAQEIFQLASLADQFRITELQEKVIPPFLRLCIKSFPEATTQTRPSKMGI